MFSTRDIDQISAKGTDLQVIEKQIRHFITGFPYVRLERPATAGDGIIRFDNDEMKFYQSFYDQNTTGKTIVKFVPASGAASRMFKHLFEFREKYAPGAHGDALFLNKQDFNSIHYFITHIEKIAFFKDLSDLTSASGHHLEKCLTNKEFNVIIDHILAENGLNYANLPKALLKFHRYADGSRTAAEEHLVEAAAYARDATNIARIHFTISPEHQAKFTQLFARVREKYENAFGVQFDISFSIQKPSTDTIAVDEMNQPMRNPDGTLLFRPGGHGALLENLNEADADLVFIKNIDNIVPDHLKGTTIEYKKLLGGYLLFLRGQIEKYLKLLRKSTDIENNIQEIADFARKKLFLDLPSDFNNQKPSSQVACLIDCLNRPIRICGMVKNEGEPGGGPFWVRGDDGKLSLQIVESSQIDMHNPAQKENAEHSTHFNPVDLVCSTRNYDGSAFDLREFVDENTGFISLKSSGGTTLKAQELPGLWNGAMAKWITVFVEVPIITFNPVKTVNDLLRTEHLSETI